MIRFRPQPEQTPTSRANAKKSSIRARVEHVFAHQKNRYDLFIRTIGLARAETKLLLANMANNFDRLIFHEHRSVMACIRLEDGKNRKADIKQRSIRCNETRPGLNPALNNQTQAVFAGLQLPPKARKTITFDNDSEFSKHSKLIKEIG